MVTIVLASGWAHRGQTRFEGVEGPLPDVIKGFAAQHPHYRQRLLRADGEPRTFYNVYLDDDLVQRNLRDDTVVPSGSTITIVPPLAGG
jgi:sulfur-carrier protein